MLKELIAFPDQVTLIPNSGVQLLDGELSSAEVARITRRFWPQVLDPETPDSELAKVILHPLEAGDDGEFFYVDEDTGRSIPVAEDETRIYQARAALKIFEGIWLPVPFLRVTGRTGEGELKFDKGPLSWARMRVSAVAGEGEEPARHRIVLAFDTNIGPDLAAGRAYTAPEAMDAMGPTSFALASEPRSNGFFLASKSVRDWLEAEYGKATAQAGRRPRGEPYDFWGAYSVLLFAIGTCCRLPQIRFVDTLSEEQRGQPVDVDLIIDVGNSRTCGILIERARGQERIDVSQATRLELRDLTRAEFAYSEPFETRVEFAPATFGDVRHARRMGRADAFWWPSVVRVGPEASWLASLNDGTEGATGLSSPKRYLWDREARHQAWANTRGLAPSAERLQEVRGPITLQLQKNGEMIRKDSLVAGSQVLYSRSSLYALMLVELLSHAICQINSIAYRYQRADRDLPRRLSHVILTVPSAMPLSELACLRQRAEQSFELLWRVMKWNDPYLHPMPKVKCDWDEASGTHLVYLYNEVNRKFRGAPRDFFQLKSRAATAEDRRTLRIASIDIGGGTTDLMIIQHEVEGQAVITPRQLFREGFRLAGDDILKAVIEDAVLPAIADALRAVSSANTGKILSDLFGGDREGMPQQQRALRSLFVNHVLAPAAINLLSLFERIAPFAGGSMDSVTIGEAIDRFGQPAPHVLAYLETPLQKAGIDGFAVRDVRLAMDPAAMSGIVHRVIRSMIDDLCDVVREYECDVLLLSGRPSRLPTIQEAIISAMAVPPDRVVPMHRYEVGNWYPFRSEDFTIRDPKTTAAVGALLCQICEGAVEGFVMRSSRLKMHSTARFIGIMSQDDRISQENVLLADADLETGEGVTEFTLPMERPLFLGFRQLPNPDWKASPLYYVSFRNPDRVRDLALPVQAIVGRRLADDEEDAGAQEDFELLEASDADGVECRDQLSFRLQTMRVTQGTEVGYWLDTGVLNTRSILRPNGGVG